MNLTGYCIAVIALIGCGQSAVAEPITLTSPGGHVGVRVALNEHNQPTYELSYRGQQLLSRSAMGLAFERFQSLSHGMAIQGSDTRPGTDQYALIGKASNVRDPYNELTVRLVETGGAKRQLDLVFRAYDDGFAFRYRIPQQSELRHLRLAGEVTEFAFPADYQCHALNIGRYTSSHEGEFDPIRASAIRYHNLLDLPAVCEAGPHGPAMAFAESNLTDYSGLYLSGRETGDLGLQARLSPRPDDPSIAVKAEVLGQGFETPWRLVMLGDRVADLVESTLVTSLAGPARGDYSWVRPGKYAWDWWNGPTLGGKQVPMTNETVKAYVDFASQSGLEYMLIDDGWYVNSGTGATVLPGADNLQTIAAIDLPALVRYAADRKVGLWLWVNWRLLDQNMEKALPLYSKLGIKGIKVDFMDRDDQEMVAFYHRLMKTAAASRLMVNLHGAFPPRGLIRTYPHYLTQEGVFGAEYNKWTRRVTARHNVNLALTRMLIGPMDYTPGGFRNVAPADFKPEAMTPLVQTTRGHALAMYVVYESPFQGVSDSPDNYMGQSGFDFIQSVPAVWDETRAISGKLGEHVALARRKGRDWYVGAMTNEAGRTLAVPLAFLGKGRWTATSWQDGGAPDEVVSSTFAVADDQTIRLRLAPSGGAVVKITPAK